MSLVLNGTTGIVSANIQDGTIVQADLSSNTASAGPAFSAYLSTNQVVSNLTYTKVNIDTETFDTASCFNPSLSRFTPNSAGYYLLTFGGRLSGSATPQIYVWQIRKNGNPYYELNVNNNIPSYDHRCLTVLMEMNGTTDYAEAWVYFSTGGTNTVNAGGATTFFNGFLAKGF